MKDLFPPLQDRLEIDDLYVRYLWALDTGDSDAYVDTFFADGIVREDQQDGSTFEGIGHEEVRKFVHKYHGDPAWAGHQHRETNRIFQLDPESRSDHYCVQSYVFSTVFDTDAHAASVTWAGYYRDVVARRDGEWKFVERWIAPWKGAVLKRFPAN